MKRQARKSERGIAMLVVLFALILVSVIGLALMFSTNAETGVNSGYRQTNLAYFAAMSGVEEVRDRIRPNGDLPGLLPKVPIGSVGASAPTAGVVYVTNLDATETASQMYPWKLKDASNNDNLYFDDELCHETADTTAIAGAPGDPSKACPRTAASLPTAAGWYNQQLAENLPGGANISYKWVRINLKMNESSSPWCVLGFGSPGSAPCSIQAGAHAAHDQVCYNGKNEFVITKADEPLDVPGRIEGLDLPSQLALAMGMYAGGSSGRGTSGHSGSTTGTSANSSSTTGGSGSGTTSGSATSSTTSGTTTGLTTTSTTSGSSTGSTTTSTTSGSSTGLTTTSTTSGSSTGLTTTSTTSGSSTGLTTTSTTSGSSTGSSTSSGSSTGSSSSSGSSNGSGSSSGSSTGSGSSSGSGTSTSTTGTVSTGTTTGSPAPACGPLAAPLPGTPIGVGSSPISAAACSDVEAQPVYMLTALAVAPNSTTMIKARRMMQYEVARIALPPVPSALTMAGPNPNANFASSGNYQISGIDADAAGTVKNGNACGGQNMPAIGTLTDVGAGPLSATDIATASRNTIINDLYAPGVKTANYNGVDPCTGGAPDVQNVQNVANSLYSTPEGLNNLVQNVENAANKFYPSGTSISNAILGTAASPQVTVVNGDLTLSGGSIGTGILLVTGTLTFKGDFTYDGVILVVGNGIFQQNGGGTGAFTGAIVVANIAGNSNYATNPTEGNLAAKLGSPSYTNSGGGGSSLTYSSCAIDIGMNSSSYTVIARREITY